MRYAKVMLKHGLSKCIMFELCSETFIANGNDTFVCHEYSRKIIISAIVLVESIILGSLS